MNNEDKNEEFIDEEIVTYDNNGNKIVARKSDFVNGVNKNSNLHPIKKKESQNVVHQEIEIKPHIYKKYEIKPDTYFYVKFGIRFEKDEIDQNVDRLIVTYYNKIDEGIENYWLKFRMWNYAEEQEWKKKCTERNEHDDYMINQIKLFEAKVRNLLLDWSFDEKLIHVNGYLSDESYADFNRLHPNIIKYVSQQLNAVLENNE